MELVMVVLVLAYAGTVGGLLKYLHAREVAHDKERQLLLNRIQAPQIAVAQTLPEGPAERSSLYFDDDEGLREEMRRLEGIDGDGS